MERSDVPAGEKSAFKHDPVAATAAVLEETAQAIREILDDIRAGDFGRIAELKKEQTLLRGAFVTAVTERQNVRKFGFSEAAAASPSELDLAAARAEVGRRLARLRAAGDASGGTEGAE